MSDRHRRSEEPSLFDLPLDAPSEEPTRAAEPPDDDLPRDAADGGRAGAETGPGAGDDPAPGRGSGALPLFPDLEETPGRRGRRGGPLDLPRSRGPAPPQPEALAGGDLGDEEVAREPRERSEAPRLVAARPAEPRPAGLASRWLAGLLDLGVHAAVCGLLFAGTWLLGERVERGELGALALFLLVFSFLYTVYPLAFWGQTPGMLRARIVAHGEEQGALTFGQTALYWIGGLLTAALLGLPSLLALAGGRSLSDRLSGTRTWER
jgi:uncharacterized RDD family membrane protein YckC